ncbi:MAG: peptidylprolyl isomerase [Bacteroidales bacterium]|nr:peptidylprolyl isomerase [Bacteroidales bacterium]
MRDKNILLFNYRFLYLIVLFLLLGKLQAQEKVVDRIIAVVGQNMVLESEVEAQYLQAKMQGTIEGSARSVKCQILENMLLENLLLNQAELDSVQVSDSEVEQSLDQRLRYFISQFGSQEKLEEYYGKSIIEIKEEFRDLVKNNMLVQEVQTSITKNVFVTPSEVKEFYRNIPTDSIPLISAQVEMRQIIKIPPVSLEQKVMIKEKLRDLRRRVVEGENFATLAILYSDDPGSAAKGGEIGFFGRGELYPEFEAVAFKLKEGEISEIVETKAGFHIIQLIERKGDYINTRHILLQTKPSPIDLENARNKLDSVLVQIRDGEITFEDAAIKYSDDPGKSGGGYIINPYTGTTWFEMDQLEPQVSFVINKLEVGQISSPVPTQTEDGKEAFRLVKLQARTEPHRANLTDDYSYLQELALQYKKQQKLMGWVNKNVDNAYIMVIDDYKNCGFNYNFFPVDN